LSTVRRFAQACGYLTAEFGLALASLLTFVIPGFGPAVAQWRESDVLRRSSSYLRLDPRRATARPRGPRGWLPLHSLLGLLFGAVAHFPAAAGLSTVWFNATALSVSQGIGDVGWFHLSGWIFDGNRGPTRMPVESWILLFFSLTASSIALTLRVHATTSGRHVFRASRAAPGSATSPLAACSWSDSSLFCWAFCRFVR
jgi:hypothetical protein